MNRFVLFILILATTFAGCKHAPKDTLPWRWSFQGASFHNMANFIYAIHGSGDEAEAMRGFFLDYKLILKKDNTFDLVLFEKYTHGAWIYEEDSKSLILTGEAPARTGITMQVDSITPASLVLRMTGDEVRKLIPPYAQNERGMSAFTQSGPFIFYLLADRLKYGNDAHDPYSRQNNTWRIKPAAPENDKQVEARVESHIRFCRLLMQDVVDGNKTYISLNSFRTPLIISSANIRLQSYTDVKDAWDEYFYDSTQAKAGYGLLEKAVIYTGIKPGATDDRFKNDVTMLDEVIENLHKK